MVATGVVEDWWSSRWEQLSIWFGDKLPLPNCFLHQVRVLIASSRAKGLDEETFYWSLFFSSHSFSVQSKIKAGDLDFLLMSVEDEPVAFLLNDIIIKFRSNALLSQPGSTLPSSFHCQAHGWTNFLPRDCPQMLRHGMGMKLFQKRFHMLTFLPISDFPHIHLWTNIRHIDIISTWRKMAGTNNHHHHPQTAAGNCNGRLCFSHWTATFWSHHVGVGFLKHQWFGWREQQETMDNNEPFH